MKLYCTGCEHEVEARLTNGEERYPHRPDLYELPFWKCDACSGYVGCHHKTDNPTKHHATCIIEKDGKYRLIDYDDNIECTDYADCINTVQKKYNINRIQKNSR
jgi:hypothetical protein